MSPSAGHKRCSFHHKQIITTRQTCGMLQGYKPLLLASDLRRWPVGALLLFKPSLLLLACVSRRWLFSFVRASTAITGFGGSLKGALFMIQDIYCAAYRCLKGTLVLLVARKRFFVLFQMAIKQICFIEKKPRCITQLTILKSEKCASCMVFIDKKWRIITIFRTLIHTKWLFFAISYVHH